VYNIYKNFLYSDCCAYKSGSLMNSYSTFYFIQIVVKVISTKAVFEQYTPQDEYALYNWVHNIKSDNWDRVDVFQSK